MSPVQFTPPSRPVHTELVMLAHGYMEVTVVNADEPNPLKRVAVLRRTVDYRDVCIEGWVS
jgi:hypothetical protein